MTNGASQGSQMPSAAVPGLGRAFDHILIIMFENMYRGYVLGNPYMRRLARQGIQLGNFFGVMHPSQTNYIASIAGELCNVTSDNRPPLLAQRTIVDVLEEAPGRLRWKGYMESYVPEATPWTPNFQPADAPPYFIKHNPFSSFSSIVRSQERWRRIENEEAALFADLLNGEFPEYAWFTPNIWSDGHWIDGTTIDPRPRAPVLVDQQARWLEQFFNRLRFPGSQSHLPPNTLVVVTFDKVGLRGGLPARPHRPRPMTGPTRSIPSFSPTGSSRLSRKRATTITACCARSRRISASTISARMTPAPTGSSSCGAAASNGARRRPRPWTASPEPLAAAGFAGALFVAGSARRRHHPFAQPVGRPWTLVGRGDAAGRWRRHRNGLDLRGARAGRPFGDGTPVLPGNTIFRTAGRAGHGAGGRTGRRRGAGFVREGAPDHAGDAGRCRQRDVARARRGGFRCDMGQGHACSGRPHRRPR